MAAYGLNSYPRSHGGDDTPEAGEHVALLLALDKVLDGTEGTEFEIEAYAHAQAIGIIWAINERLANQLQPMKMMEALASWESACRLRPGPNDSVIERRRRVAAKFRGFVGNTIADLYGTATSIFGANLVDIVTVPDASQVTYWPGVNPGPPGFEFSSNRCIICVRVNKNGISDEQYVDKANRLAQALDAMLPAWMRAVIGVYSTGFVCGVGIVGQTIL